MAKDIVTEFLHSLLLHAFSKTNFSVTIKFTEVTVTGMEIDKNTKELLSKARKNAKGFKVLETRKFNITKITPLQFHDFLVNELQLWTKYLRQSLDFMQNSALREKFNLYFSVVFLLKLKNCVIVGGRLDTNL